MPHLVEGVDYRPLGAQTETPMLAHNIICLHTFVGYLISTENWLIEGNGPGYHGTEYHLGVGGKWGPDVRAGRDLDGASWQWQDLRFTADANLDGNDDVISIGTADNGREPIEAWTPAQIDTLARLVAELSDPHTHRVCPAGWACREVGIPLELIPDTRPGRRGIGYHRQGIDPWRVGGGRRWSTARGKGCPDPARIRQVPEVITKARELRAGGALPAHPKPSPRPRPPAPTFTEAIVRQLPVLRRGMKGAAVKRMQALLLAAGYGAHLGRWGVDGSFGPATARAVREFQDDNRRVHGEPDEVCGPKTWQLLLGVA